VIINQLKGSVASLTNKLEDIEEVRIQASLRKRKLICNLKQVHAKDTESMKASLKQEFENEKADMKKEFHNKETNLKVQSTIAIANVEKKNLANVAEINKAHRMNVNELELKQSNAMDDLRQVRYIFGVLMIH
jgi:hypothetical protein